jgi:ribosomal protein S19E (S16A)
MSGRAMNRWEIVILTGFHSLGGQADLQGLYGFLEKETPMPKQHLRSTQYGGRPAYQHQVRSHVSNLVQSGALRRVERGRYALTPLGRERLQQAANELQS